MMLRGEGGHMPNGWPTAIRRQNSTLAHTNGTQPRTKTAVSTAVMPWREVGCVCEREWGGCRKRAVEAT